MARGNGSSLAPVLFDLLWPYLVAAAGSAAAFAIGRPLGVDLWLIHALARLLESATGGLLAPVALSR
ncbi:hypothetical protein [Dermacoccus abyssi]